MLLITVNRILLNTIFVENVRFWKYQNIISLHDSSTSTTSPLVGYYQKLTSGKGRSKEKDIDDGWMLGFEVRVRREKEKREGDVRGKERGVEGYEKN